jgi:hypothetical protein
MLEKNLFWTYGVFLVNHVFFGVLDPKITCISLHHMKFVFCTGLDVNV